MDKKNEIIIAGAIGDALGYPVEFIKYEQILNQYGPNGITFENNDCWIATDDTQMTLFCLEAIKPYFGKKVSVDELNDQIFMYYKDWYKTQTTMDGFNYVFSRQKILWKRRAPGTTCMQSLGSQKKGKIEKPINDSKGCGGIMRAAPIAFLTLTDEEIFKLGCMQAALTHGHPCGYLSAGFLSVLIKYGIDNYDFKTAYLNAKELVKKYNNNEDFINYLNKIEPLLNVKLSQKEMVEKLGAGWTGEDALGVSIYCMLNSDDFFDCIQKAVNHDGDSDSTGSMAAQLYAAFNDVHHVNLNYWLEKIDLKTIINDML